MPTPSSSPEMLSPTGCTKQLISVALRSVPAAELMRPPRMKPFSCARWNASSHWVRIAGASTAASARATRRRTSSIVRSPPFAYFSSSTSSEIAWGGSVGARGRRFLGSSDFIVELVCRPADSCTKSFELGDDRIGRDCPDKGLAVHVVMDHEVINPLHQFSHRAERATADGFVSDQRKEA